MRENRLTPNGRNPLGIDANINCLYQEQKNPRGALSASSGEDSEFRLTDLGSSICDSGSPWFDLLKVGVRHAIVVKHPDAIKCVLVRWNGVKIDLTKLAKLRWIEKLKSHELCQVFGLKRSAINRSIRTLRNSGISDLNLTAEEQNVIKKQMKVEESIYGGRYL